MQTQNIKNTIKALSKNKPNLLLNDFIKKQLTKYMEFDGNRVLNLKNQEQI